MGKVRVLQFKMKFYSLLFRFCKNIEEHPVQLIRNALNDDVKLFLRWILDNYPSRKRSSIFQKFKHWRQLYQKYAEKVWPEGRRVEINDVWK